MFQGYLSTHWRRPTDGRKRSAVTIFIVLIFINVLSACGSPAIPAPPIVNEPGQLIRAEDLFGTIFTYVPTEVPDKPEILVIVHGTPLKAKTWANEGNMVL